MHRSCAFGVRGLLRLLPALTAMAAASASAHAAIPEMGVWINDSGEGAIEVYICQQKADRLCGRIVWLKEPLNAQGVPKRDRYNPTPSLQTRPICGLPVLGNLARVSEGGFDNGWIYDPKVGKQYSAAIVASGNKMQVTGYLGLKMLGKSFVWTRAPAGQPRCEGVDTPDQTRLDTPPAAAPVKPAKAAVVAPPAPETTPVAKQQPQAAPPPPSATVAERPAPASSAGHVPAARVTEPAAAKAPKVATAPNPKKPAIRVAAPAADAAEPATKPSVAPARRAAVVPPSPAPMAPPANQDPYPPHGWSGDYGL